MTIVSIFKCTWCTLWLKEGMSLELYHSWSNSFRFVQFYVSIIMQNAAYGTVKNLWKISHGFSIISILRSLSIAISCKNAIDDLFRLKFSRNEIVIFWVFYGNSSSELFSLAECFECCHLFSCDRWSLRRNFEVYRKLLKKEKEKEINFLLSFFFVKEFSKI